MTCDPTVTTHTYNVLFLNGLKVYKNDSDILQVCSAVTWDIETLLTVWCQLSRKLK